MTATTFRRRPLVLGVLVAAAVATAIADVVLNPGYITGTYSVAGVTVQQAVFQASAGSQSSSAAGASGSYQLVVNVPSGTATSNNPRAQPKLGKGTPTGVVQ